MKQLKILQKMKKAKRKVEVVPYKEEWERIYQQEMEEVKQVMGELIIDIHHIGSTNIKAIKAKPIVDIMPIVKDITLVDSYNEKMQAIGYHAYGEYGLVGRRYFAKFINYEYNIRLSHLHFYEQGNAEIEQHLLFKEYLLSHLDDALEYSKLKEDLADRYSNDNDSYRLGKDLFIKNILKKAGFNRTYLRLAVTENEWQQYHNIRESKIFNLPEDQYDKNHPSISSACNLHYVFYKGAEIIGTIQIEHLNNKQVAFRNIAIVSSLKNQGFGSDLIKQAEKIAKEKGYESILLHAAKEAYNFYRRNGFIEMKFVDKEHPNLDYVDMGKQL